jgi:hypothetical protein
VQVQCVDQLWGEFRYRPEYLDEYSVPVMLVESATNKQRSKFRVSCFIWTPAQED